MKIRFSRILLLICTVLFLSCNTDIDGSSSAQGISKIIFTKDYSTQKITEVSSMELYEDYYCVVYSNVELSQITISQKNTTTDETIPDSTIDLSSSSISRFYKMYGFYAAQINPNYSEGIWEVTATGKDIDGNSVKSCSTNIEVKASSYRVYFYTDYDNNTSYDSLSCIPAGYDGCKYDCRLTSFYIKIQPNTVLTSEYFPNMTYEDLIFIGWKDDLGNVVNPLNGVKITRNNTKFTAMWETQADVLAREETNFDWSTVVPVNLDILGNYTVIDSNYVTFGLYPQTVKAVNIFISKNVSSNGYYLGSDGYYYLKVDNYQFSDVAGSYNKFLDGQSIEAGKVYYFKIEPIKWRILTEAYNDANEINQGKLLLASIIIDQCTFYDAVTKRTIEENGVSKVVYPGNYKYSNVRAFLNSFDGTGIENDTVSIDWSANGFYAKAFTNTQKNLLKEITINNKYWKNNVQYGDNTSDKVFLISKNEILTNSYGFTNDSKRKMLVSDYAHIKGAPVSNNYGYYGYGTWLSRTIDTSYEAQHTVWSCTYRGKTDTGYVNYSRGIVPAICVN